MGIGEHVWLGEIDENTFHNIDDPNFERRKKVGPVSSLQGVPLAPLIFVLLLFVLQQGHA